MMRSGTSVVAEMAVNLIGGSPGESQLSPNKHNERGYWESEPLNSVTDAVLRHLGGTWSSPPRLEDNWAKNVPNDLTRTARSIFASEFPDRAPYVFKIRGTT